jgi:hypothetical protein
VPLAAVIPAAGASASALAGAAGANTTNVSAAVAANAAFRPVAKLNPLRVIMSLSFTFAALE